MKGLHTDVWLRLETSSNRRPILPTRTVIKERELVMWGQGDRKLENGHQRGVYSGRNAASLRDATLKWEGRREKYAKLSSTPPPLLPPISQTQLKARQKGTPTTAPFRGHPSWLETIEQGREMYSLGLALQWREKGRPSGYEPYNRIILLFSQWSDHTWDTVLFLGITALHGHRQTNTSYFM